MFRALSLAALFFSIPFLSGCREREEKPLIKLGPEAPAQTVAGFETNEYAQKKVSWNLRAIEAHLYDSDRRIELSSPTFVSYRGGDPSSTMTAPSGTYYQDTKNMKMWGGVVIVSTDGARVETERLRFDSVRDRYLSDDPVVMTSSDTVTRGIGLEATRDLQSVIIRQHQVKTRAKRSVKSPRKKPK